MNGIGALLNQLNLQLTSPSIAISDQPWPCTFHTLLQPSQSCISQCPASEAVALFPATKKIRRFRLWRRGYPLSRRQSVSKATELSDHFYKRMVSRFIHKSLLYQRVARHHKDPSHFLNSHHNRSFSLFELSKYQERKS